MNVNQDVMHPGSPSFLKRLGNMLLILAQLLSGFALSAIMFSRETYRDISRNIFAQPDPIMGSPLLDVLIRKELAFVVLLILLGVLAKEFYIKSFSRRVVINMSGFVGLMLLSFVVVWLLYTPATA